MSTQIEQQQSRLKELIAKGKEQGYITYAEVNDHLPDDISDPDQIEDIIRMINDMGITVYETAPDADELLTDGENTADEMAAEEAAAALAAVETEAGRTTDPVRMYMREMGTVELLTREGEIAIAKRIEEGIRDVLIGCRLLSGSGRISARNLCRGHQGRSARRSAGWLSRSRRTMSRRPLRCSRGQRRTIRDDDDDEGPTGPDPVEAKRRFTALKRQFNKTQKVIKEKGRSDKETLAQLEKLAEAFSPFKLVPRHFDEMVEMARDGLDRVRRQERII